MKAMQEKEKESESGNGDRNRNRNTNEEREAVGERVSIGDANQLRSVSVAMEMAMPVSTAGLDMAEDDEEKAVPTTAMDLVLEMYAGNTSDSESGSSDGGDDNDDAQVVHISMATHN